MSRRGIKRAAVEVTTYKPSLLSGIACNGTSVQWADTFSAFTTRTASVD